MKRSPDMPPQKLRALGRSGLLIWLRSRCAATSLNRGFPFIAGAALFISVPRLRGARYDVTVYSYVTDAGRSIGLPTSEHPITCALVTNGQQPVDEVGPVDRCEPEVVVPLMRRLFTANHYEVVYGATTAAPDLKIVYHWGRLSPIVLDAGSPHENFVNQPQMLALVGGAALRRANSEQRQEILRAAREDRYFVIVSAYPGTEVLFRPERLLWRVYLSTRVESGGLVKTVPLLLAAGAPVFGRETVLPQCVPIDVSGDLRILVAEKRSDFP